MKKKVLFITQVFVFMLLAQVVANAQVREILLRCEADATILKDKPNTNNGYDLSNEICNFDSIGPLGGSASPAESWVRWNLSNIESQLKAGEEILYVETSFRVTWNSDDPAYAQGYKMMHLNNNFDVWNEGNGYYAGAVDNINGLTWNLAKSFGDFEDDSNYQLIYEKEQAGVVPDVETADVLEAIQKELSSDGNKIFTVRLAPYFESTADSKRWLGLISLQSPVADWSLDIDDEGYPIEAPHLTFYVGKPQIEFQSGNPMGNIENYNVKPTDFGYWMVADDEGDARLNILKPTSVDLETWNPAALAVYDTQSFQDFDFSLKAKMNYTTPSGAFYPYNDFIVSFGYEDPDNFSYFAFYGNDESGFFKVVDGIRERVGDAFPIPALRDTAYHAYSIKRVGSTVTAFVEGVEYFSLTDDALSTEGKLGVGSHNDIVFFDDLIESSIKVGIEKVGQSSVKIYPNPVKSILNINADSEINEYSILNISGQVLLKANNINANSTSINLSSFLEGVYFIKTNTEEGQIIKRFTKE